MAASDAPHWVASDPNDPGKYHVSLGGLHKTERALFNIIVVLQNIVYLA